MSRVELHPQIAFTGAAPDAGALAAMHEQAHHACFIANSVKTVVTVASDTNTQVQVSEVKL
jgi:organic hydroperoxide reductase OsmC/OhrA